MVINAKVVKYFLLPLDFMLFWGLDLEHLFLDKIEKSLPSSEK